MIPVSLTHLAQLLDARLIGDSVTILSVTTDSRAVPEGSLFVALTGERFDGHDFAQSAVTAGASALVVSRKLPLDVPQLLVSDTLAALGALGAWVRQNINPRTLALTGSCGKTTVKAMCAAILAEYRGEGAVLATAGNFNNEIGVPLTLLRLEPQHRKAVIELGANHEGEIARTTAQARPDVALVTNVAAAHLEGFGSLEGVARAKSEIFQGLIPGGTAIINRDCAASMAWLEKLRPFNVTTFGMTDEADFYPGNIELLPQGGYRFQLHTPKGAIALSLSLPGKHNIANAVAAAAATLAMGASLSHVASGLAGIKPVKGRSQLEALTGEQWLIDDSYNANIHSVQAAIELLAEREGERWLILGDLAELGARELELHAELGRYARSRGIEHLLTCGRLSQQTTMAFGEGGQHFGSREALIAALPELLKQPTKRTLLIKGSRSAQMERVAEAVRLCLQAEDASC